MVVLYLMLMMMWRRSDGGGGRWLGKSEALRGNFKVLYVKGSRMSFGRVGW